MRMASLLIFVLYDNDRTVMHYTSHHLATQEEKDDLLFIFFILYIVHFYIIISFLCFYISSNLKDLVMPHFGYNIPYMII